MQLGNKAIAYSERKALVSGFFWGSQILKVAPLSLLENMSIVPPCSETILLMTNNPNPVPFYRYVFGEEIIQC